MMESPDPDPVLPGTEAVTPCNIMTTEPTMSSHAPGGEASTVCHDV